MFKNMMIVLLMLLLKTPAMAESVLGGHVVICPQNGKPATVRLLDFLQAETKGQTISFGKTGLSYEAYLQEALNRVRRLSPLRVERYEGLLATKANWKFVPQIYIPLSEGIKDFVLPTGCSLQQMAVQQIDPATDVTTYLIDQRYWSQLSEIDKAGFIFHQLALTEQMEYAQPTSAAVRNLNNLVATNDIAKLGRVRDWAKFLNSNGYIATDMCGAWARTDKADWDSYWHSTGYLKEWMTLDEMNQALRFRNYEVPKALLEIRAPYNFRSIQMLGCNEDGSLGYVFTRQNDLPLTMNGWKTLDEGGGMGFTYRFDSQGKLRALSNAYIEFLGQKFGIAEVGISPSGTITSLEPNYSWRNNGVLEVPYPVLSKRLRLKMSVEFYEDGPLRRGILVDDTQLVDEAGITKSYPANTEVFLDHDGKVINAVLVN